MLRLTLQIPIYVLVTFVLYLFQFGSKFLFVYQSAQQKTLLRRYGCMVLLDATYKTSLYDLPLFFLAVKTNVDYQVVGSFITEDEASQSIAEALSILRDQCFESIPPYFMTDFDESEITAIERVFEGLTFYELFHFIFPQKI